METLMQKLAKLGKTLGKEVPNGELVDYKTMRNKFDETASIEVHSAQRQARIDRISKLHSNADLNPRWTFENLVCDSPDVAEAISVAKSFIAAYADEQWRQEPHLMLLYGDYGRGKSHIAGAIAHELIQSNEVTVLYQQLSSLLEMRLASWNHKATDNVGETFRQVNKDLVIVDLLIVDEVCVNETHLNKNSQGWFGQLLRQRALLCKNTILITNHQLNSLEIVLGRYCFESVKEYSNYHIQFSGPSRRRELY